MLMSIFLFDLTEVTTKEKLLSEMHEIKSNLYKAIDGRDSRVKDEIEHTARDESKVITSILPLMSPKLKVCASF